MKKGIYYICALFSWGIVAFGQPDSSLLLSIAASVVGFALFWIFLFSIEGRKKRFIASTLWFAAVQAVQLYWIATPEYQGTYIYFVYAGFAIGLGIQFGILSLFFPRKAPVPIHLILTIAGVWTLMEWSRLFFLCGFVWNPIGIAMTAHPIPSQITTLLGVFGLSFWVVVVNLLCMNLFYSPYKKKWFQFSGACILPYLYGLIHMAYHDVQNKDSQALNIALVQTSLLPDEKTFFDEKKERFVPVFDQWRYMIRYLEGAMSSEVDLVVFPESAIPFSASTPVYPYESVLNVLRREWNMGSLDLSEFLSPRYAEEREGHWFVNNHFWCQALADHYGAEVVIGMDDRDRAVDKSYSAAFHFLPEKQQIHRYEKRVLLPLAEYLPFKVLQPLVARYGISAFYTHGKKAKVFRGALPFAVSICYEECFGHKMREGRQNGAQMFVNISNDAWYPFSRLPTKHFLHGRLRALENGVPLVRACNTGVTASVDSLGRTVSILKDCKGDYETPKGVLLTAMNLYSYKTLYTVWGDYGIVGLSFLILLSVAIMSNIKCLDRESP